MSRPCPHLLTVTDGQRQVFESLARSQSGAHREVVRAKALLMAADGAANATIAATLSVSRTTVGRTPWRTRLSEDALVKFGKVREGRGRRPSIPDATIEKIVTLTQECRPEGETHWSTRTMAGAAGVSKSTVGGIWKAFGLKPHLVQDQQRSPVHRQAGRCRRVVSGSAGKGARACVDEKSQIQALDRSAPVLPMMPGLPER